ncbi:MAG: PAS domain S-box protein [Pirellulaceae bacterium]
MSLILYVSIAVRVVAVLASLLNAYFKRTVSSYMATGLLGLLLVQQLASLPASNNGLLWLDPIVSLVALLTAVSLLSQSKHTLTHEQKLRDQFAELESLCQAAPVGLCLLDNNLRFLKINHHLARINSLPIGQHLGRTVREVLPEFADLIEPIYRRVIESGVSELEFNVHRNDPNHPGSRLHYLVSYFPLKDDNGRVSGVGTLVQDISKRVRVEEKLQLTQYSVDSCSTAIFWIRHDATFFYVNEAASTLFGYSREELLEMGVPDLDPTYPAEVWPEYWSQVEREKSMTFESTIRHKNGNMVPVELTTNLVDFGGNEFVFAFVIDISVRKSAELQSQKSEERFRLAFNQQFQFMTILSPEGRVLEINNLPLKMQGCTREECVGQLFWQVPAWQSLPEWQEIIRSRLQQATMQDTPLLAQDRYQTIDGNVRYVDAAYTAIRDESGEVSFILAQAADITQRKQTEEALRESEQRFKLAFNQQFQFMVILSPEGRVLEINDLPVRTIGAPRDHFVGKLFWKTPPWRNLPEWQDIIRSNIDRARESEEPLLTETVFQTLDGTTHYASSAYTAVRDFEGKLCFLLVQGTDITEYKQSQQALRESEERWSFALDGSRDGVWDWNTETNDVYFSRRWKEMLGFADHEITNQFEEWGSRVHPHDRQQCLDDLQEHISGNSPYYENEHRIRCKDGSWKWILDRGKVISRSESNQALRVIGTHTDITDRKQAEQELRQHREMLAHVTRLSTMGQLVAGIAHEVNQPLHAIANFATAAMISLRQATAGQPVEAHWLQELQEWNTGIGDAAQRASQIIRGLREFARKGEQERVPVDLNQIVIASIDLVSFEARNSETNIETRLAGRLPQARVDRIQCEQVIVNLLHNAVEAMTEADLPRHIEITTESIDEMIEVQIADNGPGIPPEHYHQMFEPFYTTKSTGMGLGLSISRTIIEEHGGRLWATPNENMGTTFHFCIPTSNRAVGIKGGHAR